VERLLAASSETEETLSRLGEVFMQANDKLDTAATVLRQSS
jgi:hypothetical protein